jgi:ATP-binding cassette, subfamily C, type I secretion system permease/ATPase
MRATNTAASSSYGAVKAALADCRSALWSVAVFSGAVNILMLAGPLYMLQVYDRVLASRSVPTLIALTAFLIGAYVFQGTLDVIRSRVVVRVASLLDRHLGALVHAAVARLAIGARPASEAHQPVRNLDQIRAFLTGAGPIAIVDLPWMPVFLTICFLIHPWLGALSLAGGILLIGVTVLTARASQETGRALARDGGVRFGMIEAVRRNSESAVAMGMMEGLARRWEHANRGYLGALGRASDLRNAGGSLTKVLRLLLQSGVLGLGAYLVIRDELTAGAMIAASIMMGRALAPIEGAIANWRAFQAAREGIRRLSDTLARTRTESAATALPPPKRSLAVEHVVIADPGGNKSILAKAHFALSAGEALGVIGPSGSGKTSLARTLVGLWPPVRGLVRIDGAAFDQWDPARLGGHIGYLAQAVDLFDATVAENIARMSLKPDDEAVLTAAKAAGAHDMILQLAAGYDTRIGDAGAILSAGQRQRIALARALYGDPFLVVLDEPNSNLDREGEAALRHAIQSLKARGSIVVLITHRRAILSCCDKVLALASGRQLAFGEKEDVLRKLIARPVQATPPSPNLRVVTEVGSAS